jgi:hypothetical protein
MSSVKFVHVMKRIESLERDISEIHTIAGEINSDRDYSTSLKISLEQQVNNLLNEKTRLMEVRIENAPDYLNPEKKKSASLTRQSHPAFSFDTAEREYYENLRHKRSNYLKEPAVIQERIKTEAIPGSKDLKGLPSLAEKSLVKAEDLDRDDEKSFIKRREDLLKNLPPLEY